MWGIFTFITNMQISLFHPVNSCQGRALQGDDWEPLSCSPKTIPLCVARYVAQFQTQEYWGLWKSNILITALLNICLNRIFSAKEWCQLSSLSHSQRKVLRPSWQLWAIGLIWNPFSPPPSTPTAYLTCKSRCQTFTERLNCYQLTLSPAAVTVIGLPH